MSGEERDGRELAEASEEGRREEEGKVGSKDGSREGSREEKKAGQEDEVSM